jgi:hypothetical protein
MRTLRIIFLYLNKSHSNAERQKTEQLLVQFPFISAVGWKSDCYDGTR